MMSRAYTVRMLFFGTLLLTSLLALLVFVLPKGMGGAAGLGSNEPTSSQEGFLVDAKGEVDWGAVLSVGTAVISGLGFMFTTYFSYREDRRAAALHHLQLINVQKELARKELEIEDLRRRLQNQREP